MQMGNKYMGKYSLSLLVKMHEGCFMQHGEVGAYLISYEEPLRSMRKEVACSE